MATKAKRYMYQIQYTDNTYRVIDLTKEEWKSLGIAIYEKNPVIVLDDAVLVLSDVRAIVYIPVPEPELEKEETVNEDGQLTEWGFVTPEEAANLRELGIDIGKVNN